MSSGGFAAGRGKKQTAPDKVDMSLDDIIRLNRREQQTKKRLQPPGGGLRRPPLRRKGGIAQGPGPKARHGPPRNAAAAAAAAVGPRVQKAAAGGGVLRGGVSKLRLKRGLLLLPPHMARRRAQVGVVTGLASRRPTSLQRGFQPARSAYAQRVGQRLGQMGQRTQPFVQRPEAQYQRPQAQRRPGASGGPYRGKHQIMDPQQRGQASASPGRRPFQLRRRPLPPAQQAQRDSRQATFLSNRGLKVHTQVQKQSPYTAPVRTRQWRNSTKNNGLLTVSIDNPTARTQPEPPTAWSLHPQPAAPDAPLKLEPVERKTPKGVPLQFDINSVAKPQTVMTLNERFRILKDQRVTAQGSKGSRFVTVS